MDQNPPSLGGASETNRIAPLSGSGIVGQALTNGAKIRLSASLHHSQNWIESWMACQLISYNNSEIRPA